MLCHSMSFVKKKKKFSGKIGFKTWKDIEILGIDFFFEETFLTTEKKNCSIYVIYFIQILFIQMQILITIRI